MKTALALALFATANLAALPSCADERLVWRIGTFDHSSGEFFGPQGVDYTDPKKDPVWIAGKSKPARDWQGFQPGSANASAGGRRHPFTIVFGIAQPPRGVYRFTIAMLYETQRLSHLRVIVNGHEGDAYFHPKLDYAAGDWQGTFVSQTSYDQKTIDLPSELFRLGENRITLIALDEPDMPQEAMGAIVTGHTGIVYDALELTHLPTLSADRSTVRATVIPTIFFRGDAHKETEVVEAYVDFGRVPQKGEIALSALGKTARYPFTSDHEFGEVRAELDLPAWNGKIDGELKVSGESEHKFPVALTAQKRWTVFIVPHEHLDIGFTDYPARVAELHAESLDGAMEIIRKVPDFFWTPDGFWVLDQYFASRSAKKIDELTKMIQAGKIAVPAAISNQHTANASLEGLARSLYDSHEFARNHALTIDTAHITDVPSYSWSYASVLHDAGIKYFVAGSNSWRAPVALLGKWNERSPFYWEGPDGGRVLMWFSRAYLQLHTLFGSPPRVESVHDALPVFLQAYMRPDYTASSAIIFGSQLENTPLVVEQAELPAAWAKRYAWPKLEFATFSRAMATVEKQWQGSFPVYRGDFGPAWEDGFGSDALHTAIHRENQQRITLAETLSTLPSLINSSIHADFRKLKHAWENILRFDEHTWTFVLATTQPEAEQTVRQTELKRAQTIEARKDIDETVQRAWEQLGAYLSPKDNSVIVFNSLSWARSGIVEIDLPVELELDDKAGKPIEYETVFVGKGMTLPGFGGSFRRVRFRADVPAVGYAMYALRPAHGVVAPITHQRNTETIENAYYRVVVDPRAGAVASVYDKLLSRELVDPKSTYRFGAFLYVTGADDMPHNSLYRFGAAIPPPHLTVHPAERGKIVSLMRSPLTTTITLQSQAVNTPEIITEIVLYNHEKRIDFNYHLTKQKVLTKEAAYIAFPFASSTPNFSFDTQNGFVDPTKDKLPGSNREWFIANRWAAIHDGNFAAAIVMRDAPLVTFGDIVRGIWPTDFSPKNATIFSWVMNNYWGTNFVPWQGGAFTFRYSLVSDKTLSTQTLNRTALQTMTPLEASTIPAATTPSKLPAEGGSLLQIDNPNVVLSTWKMAEDGRGTIVRLVEIGGQTSNVKISSPLVKFYEVMRCSVLEDDRARIPLAADGLSVSLKPFEIATLRIITEPPPVTKPKTRHR